MPQNFLFPQRDQPLLMPVDMREWLKACQKLTMMSRRASPLLDQIDLVVHESPWLDFQGGPGHAAVDQMGRCWIFFSLRCKEGAIQIGHASLRRHPRGSGPAGRRKTWHHWTPEPATWPGSVVAGWTAAP
jgi:hypothetical protein